MAKSAVSMIGGLLLTASVTLTACGTTPIAPAADSTASPSGTSAGASSPASPSTASSTTATGGSPSQTSAPAAGEVPPCANPDLTVSVRAAGVGLGHVGTTIVFTNGSDHQCTLFGYPDVAGMDSTGRQVTHALQTLSGYLGGASTKATVQLALGGRASALVEGTDVPAGTATTCPVYPGLLVTAPNQTRSHILAVGMPGCSPLQVHPVVAGETGRA